jgi:hypothetical protein
MAFGFRRRQTHIDNPDDRLVKVAFHELTDVEPAHGWGAIQKGYHYLWELTNHPQVGYWVIVKGGDNRDATTVVIAINQTYDDMRAAGYDGPNRKAFIRLVTDTEFAHAYKYIEDYLDYARIEAGLPTDRAGRRASVYEFPIGWPEIGPASGKARDPLETARYLTAWRRACEFARTDEEFNTFQQVAAHWSKQCGANHLAPIRRRTPNAQPKVGG